jgi:hypothetical protein
MVLTASMSSHCPRQFVLSCAQVAQTTWARRLFVSKSAYIYREHGMRGIAYRKIVFFKVLDGIAYLLRIPDEDIGDPGLWVDV